MEDVKVCRICLNMDVKMYDLQLYPLELYFASTMIESKPLYTNLLPYICYECAAIVKKFYLFREKCLRSQVFLCKLIDDFGKLTPAALKSIDRQSLLTVSTLTHVDIEQDTLINSLDIETPEFAVEVIKKEDHDDVDIPDQITPDPDSSDDEECQEEKDDNMKNLDVKKVKIHEDVDILEASKGTKVAKTTAEVSKLPPKRKTVIRSKKQARPKRNATIAIKKKQMKANENKGLSSEDKTDIEEITVITLSIEEQLEEFNKRKQSSNYLNCPYQCHSCYKGFNNTHTWKHHINKHSPNLGDIECTICKYRFKTKRNLQRHALNHGKRYVCKLCPYKSSNITTVKQHQGSHKGVTHKCDYCDEVFTVRTTYVSHMRIKHPGENICEYCGYSFYSKQGLLVHKNMVHKDVEIKAEEDKGGPFCAECDVKFLTWEAYNRHTVMSVKHTGRKDSMTGCRVCAASFSDPEELRLHHRKEHPKRQYDHHRSKASRLRRKYPAKCEHCSEEFENARTYWKHFRLMHPDENYPLQKKCVCDICGKRFVCNALLVIHKRTHFGERPYKCSQCDKACFSAFDLRVHQQKHSDTRPFPCNVCPMAFKRKEALERHLKIHSGDNPYKCEICGVAFNKSCTRTLHVRTVHTKEPPPPRKHRNKLNKNSNI